LSGDFAATQILRLFFFSLALRAILG